MSLLSWIEDQNQPQPSTQLQPQPQNPNQVQQNLPNSPKKREERGLWTRCDQCGTILYIKHLKAKQRICFACGCHLQMDSKERIFNLIDADTWCPFNEILSPCDPIKFLDQKTYIERLQDTQDRTDLQDAILTGTGLLDGLPVALGVMDFNFMGGSMGSVVGEKITRLIEYATYKGLTLILICASGGARMQEGILSLMQMAKISAALQIYQSLSHLLYISILTSPTTGGVTASFAMLGDLVIAEPNALIGFAGRRVIEQTLQEKLPDQFQTAEYLFEHGFLNLIIERSFLKQALSEILSFYNDAPLKKPGNVPLNFQRRFDFLTEELIRRKLSFDEKNDIQKNFLNIKNEEDSFIFNRFIYEFSLKHVESFSKKDDSIENIQSKYLKDDFSELYREILISLNQIHE